MYLYEYVLDLLSFSRINSLYFESDSCSWQLRADNIELLFPFFDLNDLVSLRVARGLHSDEVIALEKISCPNTPRRVVKNLELIVFKDRCVFIFLLLFVFCNLGNQYCFCLNVLRVHLLLLSCC